jgi:hypothetical protein
VCSSDLNALSCNTASNNTAVGYCALRSNTAGTCNIAVGTNSGCCITTGACNVILGSASANGFGAQNNNIFISDGAGNTRIFVTGSNGFVGVNTTTPQFQLDVSGSGNFTGDLTITGSLILSGSNITTAWTSYTPDWTAASSNPAIGNGTIEGYYKIIGKTCFVRGNIVIGSTTTFGTGEWYVSMPFTASNADGILMTANLLDNGTAWYNAVMNGARAGFNYKAPIQYQAVGGTANDVNPTQPFAWATSDRFIWNGSYEIA